MCKSKKSKNINCNFFYEKNLDIINTTRDCINCKEVLDCISEEDIYNYERELGIIDIFNSSYKIPF